MRVLFSLGFDRLCLPAEGRAAIALKFFDGGFKSFVFWTSRIVFRDDVRSNTDLVDAIPFPGEPVGCSDFQS